MKNSLRTAGMLSMILMVSSMSFAGVIGDMRTDIHHAHESAGRRNLPPAHRGRVGVCGQGWKHDSLLQWEYY